MPKITIAPAAAVKMRDSLNVAKSRNAPIATMAYSRYSSMKLVSQSWYARRAVKTRATIILAAENSSMEKSNCGCNY